MNLCKVFENLIRNHIEIGGHTKKSDNIIKRVKDYTYSERLEKLGLTTLLERRMRNHLIETFKIINGITNYG